MISPIDLLVASAAVLVGAVVLVADHREKRQRRGRLAAAVRPARREATPKARAGGQDEPQRMQARQQDVDAMMERIRARLWEGQTEPVWSAEQRDAYRVLGIEVGADANAVRAAYRRRIKLAHPDHGGSEAKVRAVLRAKQVLGAD